MRPLSKTSSRMTRMRLDLLQSNAAMYRGMLRIESREATRNAARIFDFLSLGMRAGRMLSSLFRRGR